MAKKQSQTAQNNAVLFPELGELKPGEKTTIHGSTVQRVPGGFMWLSGTVGTYIPLTELAAAECGLEIEDAADAAANDTGATGNQE